MSRRRPIRMHRPHPRPAADSLLRHERGLRAVARGLLADDGRIDDVIQETWLRAIASPPRSPAALGAWLRVVTARIACTARLSDERRARHEHRAGAPTAVAPSAAEVFELETVHRRIEREVCRLEEPYRTTIREHFFTGRSAREIAARTGTPLETVRTRLKRGLRRLRGALAEPPPPRAIQQSALSNVTATGGRQVNGSHTW